MTTFQKRTLRNLSPLAREIAEAINECDDVKRRLTRLLAHMGETELDAQALRHKFPDLASDPRQAWEQRRRGVHNRGRYTVAELDESFHDPLPLEQKVLGG